MEGQNKAYLLHQLRTGSVSREEMQHIEKLLSDGALAIEDIPELMAIQDRVDLLRYPEAPKSLGDQFHAMLAAEKARHAACSRREFFAWPAMWRFALPALMLVIGLATGYLLRSHPEPPGQQIEILSKQVSELQEMMMLALLEKGSTTERLRAVTLTRDMDEASKKVTTALIETLNEDENINVRLAALEALKPYAGDSAVREALVRSISKQESPLVQISLAELMVALQEKAAIEEFEKLIRSESTPPEIKKRIRESINILI